MSKKKRKRQNATEDDVIGVNDDGREFTAAAADSEESDDDDDIAADSMIKVTFHICLVPGSRFALSYMINTKSYQPSSCKHTICNKYAVCKCDQ